jgi:hypothetical protein
MRLIKEYSQYSIMTELVEKLSTIFNHVNIYNKTILASSELDKSGKPKVRIDSKTPIKALMLKLESDSIEIKSIVNSTEERGLSGKVIDVILSTINKDWTIFINQDVSGGFWDRVIEKYPHWKFIKK